MGTTSGGRRVASKGSGHKTAAPPQMSKNVPAPPPALPYVTTADSADAQGTSAKTKIGGEDALVDGSYMPTKRPGNAAAAAAGGDLVTQGIAGMNGQTVVSGGSGKTTSGGKGLARTFETVNANMAAPTGGVPQVTGVRLEGADADALNAGAEAAAAEERARLMALAAVPGKADGPPGPATCQGTDPVVAATGLVVDDFVDLATPGVITVQWRRHYSSGRAKERGALGRGGWALSLEQWIEAGESIWRVRAEDGRWIFFEKVSAGGETFHRRERLTLRHDARGRWIEVEGAATRQVRRFAKEDGSERYLLRSIRDPSGNTVALRYEGDRLVEVVDTAGRRLRVIWAALPEARTAASGAIARVEIWSAGDRPQLLQWVDYAYHGSGELSRVSNAMGGVQSFEYDGMHRLVRRTLETGVGFRYWYDDSGRCARTAGDGGIYDTTIDYDLRKRTTTTSGHEESRRYTWNSDGQITREETLDGHWARTAEYDADGYLVAGGNAAGDTTRRRYDARGNLVELVDPAGNVTRWRFEEDRPVSRRDPDNNETLYQHDARGLLIGLTRPTGEVYALAYDARGRLEAVWADGVQLHTFAYDAEHNLVRETDARGATTDYAYDALGRPVARRDALGRMARIEYDTLGRPVARRMPDGSVTRTQYDPRGRVAEVIDALGNVTRMQYGGLHALERIVDAHGQSWTFQYDDLERLRRIENPLHERYDYEYDAVGRIVSERAFHGRRQQYRYDRGGNLTRIDLPGGLFRSIQYDPLGNVVLDGSAHGTLRFQRDKLGRLSRAVVDEVTGKVVTDIERDRYGRVVYESQDGAQIAWTRDRRGRVIERVLPSGATTRYHYDAGDALVGVEQDGKKFLIQRDVLGRELRKHAYDSRVDIVSAYDDADRLVEQRVTAPSPEGGAAVQVLAARSLQYDALGRPTRIEDARWGATAYQHDALGQLVLAARGGKQEVFEYDPTGSLVNILGDLGHRERTTPWRTRTGNLLTHTPTAVYENDIHGRRIRKTPLDGRGREVAAESVRYDWDVRDRLREVAFASGKRVLFAYDAFGRRVKKTVIPAERADAVGMVLLAAERGAAALPKCEVTRYLWDRDAHAAETTASGRTRIFVSYPGTTVPLLQAEASDIFLVVNDHLGTPKELVGEDGEVAWAARHSAWGTVTNQQRGGLPGESASGTVDSPFRLSGQFWDGDVGLCATRFRWFDAETARWLSPDPLEGVADLRSLGFAGSPTFSVDPYGLECKKTGDATTSPWLADPRAGVVAHLELFRAGGSFLITEGGYKRFVEGASIVGRPDGQFMIDRASMDRILLHAGGDIAVVEKALGIPSGSWSFPMYRVDVEAPLMHNARLPNGSESGANSQFKWGGNTSGGSSEIVTDPIPSNGIKVSKIGG